MTKILPYAMHCFNADPDPAFFPDTDPDPDPGFFDSLDREKNCLKLSSNFFSQIFKLIFTCNGIKHDASSPANAKMVR